MKIVLAPDSFKECLEASAVCDYLAKGIFKVDPHAQVVFRPMADGGEGSSTVLCDALGLTRHTLSVSGPLGVPVAAWVAVSEDSRTAVVEAAQANGLALVKPADRNPLVTSTNGVGELIRFTLEHGAETVYLCIGGSATVDGGKGMAEALGYQFLDATGKPLPSGGGSLVDLDTIVPPPTLRLGAVSPIVLCDVTNPLLGEQGAASVFGPQKGATPDMVPILEAGLKRLADRCSRDLGVDLAHLAGAGAAGGLGFGLATFMNADLTSGAQVVMDAIEFDSALEGADMVITGEGRSDSQTLHGKVAAAVAERAAKQHIPVHIISGAVGDRDTLEASEMFASLTSLSREGDDLETAIAQAPQRLEKAAEALMNRYLSSS